MRYESNYIAVQQVIAAHTRDFHDTAMCGDYYKHERAGAENGPMFSACCVELSVAVLDGYGTLRTMSGPKSTQSNKNDGSISMLAKKLGITRGCTQMGGERRCLTA